MNRLNTQPCRCSTLPKNSSKVMQGSEYPMATKVDPHFVYIIRQANAPLFKIGFAKDVKARIRQLQTGCPSPIKIFTQFPVVNRDAALLSTARTIHRLSAHLQRRYATAFPVEAQRYLLLAIDIAVFGVEAHRGYLKERHGIDTPERAWSEDI